MTPERVQARQRGHVRLSPDSHSVKHEVQKICLHSLTMLISFLSGSKHIVQSLLFFTPIICCCCKDDLNLSTQLRSRSRASMSRFNKRRTSLFELTQFNARMCETVSSSAYVPIIGGGSISCLNVNTVFNEEYTDSEVSKLIPGFRRDHFELFKLRYKVSRRQQLRQRWFE